MTALTQDRNTPWREGDDFVYPVKGSTKVFGGSQAAVDANGLAVPAADTAGLTVVGIAQEYVDNSAGADSAKTVRVRRGVFQVNSASLTAADVGKPVYVSDDQTVSKSATTNKVAAGILEAIDGATKAWVRYGPRPASGLADIATADAATQGGTYVQADVQSIATLANANKAAVNSLLAKLRSAGLLAP